MPARILVTGGAGYIGSHACKALAAGGYEPVAYDNLCYGHEDAVQWGELARGDIRDGDRLEAVMRAHKVEAVIHFAAFAYVGESVVNPDKYYDNNVSGHLQPAPSHAESRGEQACLLIDLRDLRPAGNAAYHRNNGSAADQPLRLHQARRRAHDHGFRRAYDVRYVLLRYFNAAGADPDGDLGERHDPETHAIPLAIQSALGTGPRFQIFGTDYDTPDGTAIRDYVHVSDLADAHVRALGYLDRGGASDAFNLATGRGVSVNEIVEAVERAIGRPVGFRASPRREGDPPALYATGAKARDALGWSPRYESIDDIVQTAVRWFMRDHNRVA